MRIRSMILVSGYTLYPDPVRSFLSRGLRFALVITITSKIGQLITASEKNSFSLLLCQSNDNKFRRYSKYTVHPKIETMSLWWNPGRFPLGHCPWLRLFKCKKLNHDINLGVGLAIRIVGLSFSSLSIRSQGACLGGWMSYTRTVRTDIHCYSLCCLLYTSPSPRD